MADSDEESERRRSRDKFRRERSDNEGRRRPGDKREPFDDRSGTLSVAFGRGDCSGNNDRQNENKRDSSPLLEPPHKKIRKNYGEEYRTSSLKRRDARWSGMQEHEVVYRPPIIPFKRFLEPLDDFITDEEACSKYREYKDNHLKKVTEEFFEAHKNEEWLRLRYHPDYIDARKAALTAAVKQRLSVFMELYEKDFLKNQSVQMDNSENLIKLMDAVVIKLEGGSDDDLKVLDEPDRNRFSDDEDALQRKTGSSCTQVTRLNVDEHKSEGEAESDIDGDDSDKVELSVKQSPDISQNPPTSERHLVPSISCSRRDSADLTSTEQVNQRKHELFKTERESQESYDLKLDEIKNIDEKPCASPCKLEAGDVEDDVPTPTTAEAPDGVGGICDGPLSPASSVLLGAPLTCFINNVKPLNSHDPEVKVEQRDHQSSSVGRRKPLHKTASLFFRALPPTLTEAELKELCSSQPGFIRLALWEPAPERRFTRHAWATYEPNVNIKKVCWALNTSPLLREKLDLPNGELGATVNRDLAQRVRPLTPLTRHKPVMRQDLLLASQLVALMDSKSNLWTDDQKKPGDDKSPFITVGRNAAKIKESASSAIDQSAVEMVLRSNNPFLKNITDYLVDEGGSEEAALLSETCNNSNEVTDGVTTGRNEAITLESDPALARALDLLILYLRIVHSVDYYAAAVYPMEDSMPHRCGILHARGDRGLNSTVPGGRPSGLTFSQREIDDHMQNFGLKIRSLIRTPKDLSDEEMKKLGMRDPEKAVEEFIEANIQKRTGKKKPFKVVWVCPLSDKKFREPIFVRKHIFNKHMDKVEAAKKDNAIFFNNYLRDPRRPALPEAPYHLIDQYYPTTVSSSVYKSQRGAGRGGGYRGIGFRSNPLLSTTPYSRGISSFQDYYDVATQQQQAMAAVAAAAAAALYPNAATTDLYALAAAGAARSGVSGPRRPQRGPSPYDRGNRLYHSTDNRRKYLASYGETRRPSKSDRGMISYNDLDDPGNDGL